MDRIDKKLEKLGFTKVKENESRACYDRLVSTHNHSPSYVHRLDIDRKKSGNHEIHSYRDAKEHSMNPESVPLTVEESKLILKKFNIMRRKYNWE